MDSFEFNLEKLECLDSVANININRMPETDLRALNAAYTSTPRKRRIHPGLISDRYTSLMSHAGISIVAGRDYLLQFLGYSFQEYFRTSFMTGGRGRGFELDLLFQNLRLF